MKTKLCVFVLLAIFSGCDFSKSVKKDFVSGLLTTGDGISCNDVYLSVNDGKTTNTDFVYGQTFKILFSDVEGLKKINEYVFPGMQITVVTIAGDTIFQSDDLYADYSGGMNLSPLLLTAEFTAAAPVRSNGEYEIEVNIWDKKDKGIFTAKMDFKVIPNPLIKISSANVNYNEIYLFSKERGIVITDDKLKFNENTYVMFEGLSGFKEENGMVFPGLSIKGTDNTGNIIMDYSDLFADYSESGIGVADFNSRISSNFNIQGTEFKNPLNCELRIWDKKSDGWIKVQADLIVE